MYDLPPDSFPRLFPQFVLYQIVSRSITLDRTDLIYPILERNFRKEPKLIALTDREVTVFYMTNLIDINDLKAILKLGRTAAYQATNDPSFPAAIYLNARTKRWEIADVELWLQGRKGMKSPNRQKMSNFKTCDVIDGVRFERVGA